MLQRCVLFWFAWIFLWAVQTDALDIPQPTGYRVNDFASLLSPDTKNRLESELTTFEKETTTQIVVATFLSLEQESLEDFTNRMFEAWKIGQANRDNGVLVAIFVKERKVRIEVGYGLEGVLPDALSAQIIRNELVPEFRAGNMERGIEKALAAIQKAVRGEYKAEDGKQQPISYASIIFALIVIIFFFRMMRQGITIGPHYRRRRYDDTWWGGGWSGGSRGGWSGGGGGFSGGGGSSGGGGASGSW